MSNIIVSTEISGETTSMQIVEDRWGAELVAWAQDFLGDADMSNRPIDVDGLLNDSYIGFFTDDVAAGRAMLRYQNPALYEALKAEGADLYFDFQAYFDQGLVQFARVTITSKGGFWLFNPNL